MYVVAYYTKDTVYEDIIVNLLESIEKYKLKYHIVPYVSRGSWELNCAIKPEFLLHCINTLDEDILYVDADACIRKPLGSFEGEFQYYRLKGEALSGTLYLKNCDNVRRFLAKWLMVQKDHPTMWDQKTMDIALREASYLDVRPLNPQYVKIFDIMSFVPDPYIEHYQASRTARKDLGRRTMPNDFVVPKGIRQLSDGTYYLVRPNKTTELYMDKHLKRIGNDRRWYSYIHESESMAIADLFKGQTANIIGKGPSLDLLNESHIVTGPIFALNETVHTVEKLQVRNPILCVQQDRTLGNTCKPSKVTTKLMLSFYAKECCSDFPNRFVYRPDDIGVREASLSVQAAIELARITGCKSIRLICFDACVNGKTEYAKAIGYSPTKAGNPSRFLRHKKLILDQLRSLDYEFIIPESNDDKPQLPSDNQQESHEPLTNQSGD